MFAETHTLSSISDFSPVQLLYRMFICLLTPLTVRAKQLWLHSNNNTERVCVCVHAGIHCWVCVKSWGVCLLCWEPHLHTLTCVQSRSSVQFKLTQLLRSWDWLLMDISQPNISFVLNMIIKSKARKHCLKGLNVIGQIPPTCRLFTMMRIKVQCW